MNEKTRFIIAKYLLAIAALLPIKNKANAKPGYNLPSNIYATCGTQAFYLSVSGGFITALPIPKIDESMGQKQITGFNGGGFIEIGGAHWRKIDGTTMEYHLEPVARFEVLSLNTCAYTANNAQDNKQQIATQYPYESIQNFLTSANINFGLGYNGICVEGVAGLGYRTDTKQKHSATISCGAGLTGRINNQVKIRIMYRTNVDINTNPNNPAIRPNDVYHTIEAGVVYMIKDKRQKNR